MIDTSTVLIGLISAIVPAAVGYLLKRAISGVDSQVSKLDYKVETLSKQDTTILIELADLRARVTFLELFLNKKP